MENIWYHGRNMKCIYCRTEKDVKMHCNFKLLAIRINTLFISQSRSVGGQQ